jgi:16S rRNA (cytosine1402-N4)-methyltransferase
MIEYSHETVLRQELLELFLGIEEGLFVDGTIGGAGFSLALLRTVRPGVRLLGLDLDPEALQAARARLAEFKDRVQLFHGNFAEVPEVLARMGNPRVVGMVLDLGVSSHLLDGERGFSFRKRAPLDMRMNPTGPVTARELLARLSPRELEEMFAVYGEIHNARRLAQVVKQASDLGALECTTDLADLVRNTFPNAGSKLLARVFQALRIKVNGEIESLCAFLRAAPSLLAVGGRVSLVSFHSLEDRATKIRFKELAAGGDFRLGCKKPIVPSEEEIRRNPRARSAKARWIERVK